MPLHSERRGQVALLTVDRQERLNALDGELLDALAAEVAAIADDEAVGAVVVTGAGTRAFSAGADVSTFGALDPVAAEALMARGHRAFDALEALPRPTVAAINGYALGGGLELALACDYRVVATGARVGQPEVTLANVPGWGATQRLPRLVGEPVAKDLILTGRLLTAEEAVRVGIAHRSFEDKSLLDEALALAERVAAHPPVALAMAKQAVHAARGADGAGAMVEAQAVGLCFTTEAQQQALERFGRGRRKEVA